MQQDKATGLLGRQVPSGGEGLSAQDPRWPQRPAWDGVDRAESRASSSAALGSSGLGRWGGRGCSGSRPGAVTWGLLSRNTGGTGALSVGFPVPPETH